MSYPSRGFIVETGWLESNLSDPDLRIIDCRQNFGMDENGDISFSSAKPDWVSGHIPGAAYVDIREELSDRSTDLPFMLPGAADFTDVMSRVGVEDGVHVVLYDSFFNIWAARLWWMLRAFGFRDAAVLNGGLTKWRLENRPLATEGRTPARSSFVARPDEGVFVGKQAVLAAIDDDETCIVDALQAGHYSGETPVWVDRPGHIESAENLPFDAIVDHETHAYLPPEELAPALEQLGLATDDAVITYCHAGNAASSVAFAMALMGHEHVSIYDASLREWAADPSLPMRSRVGA